MSEEQQMPEYKQGDNVRLTVELQDQNGVGQVDALVVLQGSSSDDPHRELHLTGWPEGHPRSGRTPPEAGGGCADERGGSAASGRLRVSAHRRRERLSRSIMSRARPAAVPSDSRAPGRRSTGTGVSIRRDVLVAARSLIHRSA